MNRLIQALNRADKIYHDLPGNWYADLAPYIEDDLITCQLKLTQCLTYKEPMAFIDACSIIKLAAIPNRDPIIRDICAKYKAIIITGEVVKELSSETRTEGIITVSSDWVQKQVAVVHCFAQYNKLLYIQETDLCEHFYQFLGRQSTMEKRTLAFMRQISNAKNYTNKITILSKNDPSFQKIYTKVERAPDGYTTGLIHYLKSKKKSGDSLAEFLILLIINMVIFEDMTRLYFISDDRRADLIYQKVVAFQRLLKRKKAISEARFMGRVEIIYFIKSCVSNKTVTSDDDIIQCCNIYLGDNGAYKTTVSGGMYPEPETVSLSEKQLLSYMRNSHYNFHSTSNRDIEVQVKL